MNAILQMLTKNHLRPIYALVAGVALILGSAHFAAAQVIRLNAQATVEARQDVRLGDVAAITGADAHTAEILANLVVVPEIKEGRTIRAEGVLVAVIAQVGPGTLADHLQVAGAATCVLEVQGGKGKSAAAAPAPAVAAAPAPNQAQALAVAPPEAPRVITAVAIPAKEEPAAAATPGQTLSQLITSRMQKDLDASPDDVGVTFDTINPAIDQVPAAGRKWVIRPLSHSQLGTVQFDAQLIEDSHRVVQKIMVQANVTRRETILVAVAPLVRGDVITKDQFRPQEQWLDRAMPTLLLREKDVIGMEALRPIAVGSALDQRDFRPVEMAARGDPINVIFVHGSLKVQMKARAVDSGKLHDTIQVKNEATNDTYQAVLIGKQLAVVGGTLSEAEEKKLRENR